MSVITVLIIANGLLPEDGILQKCVREADAIICADGGANQALSRQIRPDYVVGDFDSIRLETRLALTGTIFVQRPSQYSNDLEKSLHYAEDLGANRVLLVGATGLRLDHQICNLSIVQKFCARVQIIMYDDYGVGCFLTPDREHIFDLSVGRQVSLFSFGNAQGIVTQGLKYPLHNESLEWAIRDGLSNEVVETPVKIRFGSGMLFFYRVRVISSR
ncbi:MAG: thiamine diphosphokinase [Candidatus Cloacimonetes bacterium 4572_55]|nr:MAG: thiamine diphosphokinase [Candidatus Cloacimonetes bacterium 4572_55]